MKTIMKMDVNDEEIRLDVRNYFVYVVQINLTFL